MKIEIEIPDLEELYTTFEGETITSKDLKRIIAEKAIEKFIDGLYKDYVNDDVYVSIVQDARAFIKEHSGEIINKVVENVTSEILKKKAIIEQMPKKSEIAAANKEWENYFLDLINKAIRKKFGE